MYRHPTADKLFVTWSLIAAVSGVIGCSQTEAPGEFQSFDSLETAASAPGQNRPSDNVTSAGGETDGQATSDRSSATEVAATAAAGTGPESGGDPAAADPAAADPAAVVSDGADSGQPRTAPTEQAPDRPADNDVPQSVTSRPQDAPGTTPPTGKNPTPAQPRQVKVLVTERAFQTEGPQKSLRVTYDDIDLLKVLNMEPVTPNAAELMPQWLSGLNDRRILIRGFMYPTFQETGLQGFILARDNQICCFGRDPKIYDLVRITLRKGVTTSYIQGRPFDVEGVFRIRPESEDGELYRLYSIDDAVVIDR